ncbi:hypothetical protein [Vibrio toranzoniae]|uniref:hypothetical protein n=1 Tax=Vibrio toranzoniae TaxID=1194427 RepID=UPI0013766321|nr:hypothetical protein [Vibrio toranzoniae]NAZ94601.1 hypothetical protein [Vibrio toranzoniae]
MSHLLALTLLLIRWCVFFVLAAEVFVNSLVALDCQVSRTNPLPVKVLQTVVVCRLSLLSQVRFVGWI